MNSFGKFVFVGASEWLKSCARLGWLNMLIGFAAGAHSAALGIGLGWPLYAVLTVAAWLFIIYVEIVILIVGEAVRDD